MLTYVYPVIGDLPVSEVDTKLVMRVLAPHWAAKRETMSRVRGRIEVVLDWATTRQFRDGDNPARWRGHLSNLLAKAGKKGQIAHFRALPYIELPAFMAKLRAIEGILARSLEFLILTAARRDEVRLARWAEIDLAGRIWVIPGTRMKTGRDRRVPLSDRAVEILQFIPHHSPYIFPGQRSAAAAPNMMLWLLKVKMGVLVTVHGFRSTFRDWCAETGVDHDLAEQALAHFVGSAVERAYKRSDLYERRRQLAEAWAHYCEGEEPAESKVVRLAGRAG